MSSPKDNTSALTLAGEAVEWFVTLQASEVSRENQKAFADWLRRSPVHVEEFLQLTALHGDLARLPELQSLDVNALLAEVSQAGARRSSNVLFLNPGPRSTLDGREGEKSSSSFARVRGERSQRRMSVVTAALALIAVGLWLAGPIREFLATERYSTDMGEQRVLTLADGSHVQLNVRSSLSAKVNETVRELRLEEGEALFQVAKDAAHPFRVHTPQATIEAKGTQFNVRVKNGETVVALLEGRVEVLPPRGAAPITLNPGEQITVASRSNEYPAPRAADLKTVTAWTDRRLVFEDAPLFEVIAEFNRYNLQPLAIEDPTLHNVRITASFDSGNAQIFAESLVAARLLRVTRQPNGVWLIER